MEYPALSYLVAIELQNSVWPEYPRNQHARIRIQAKPLSKKKKRNPPPPSPSLPKNPVRSTLYSHRHPPQECAACHAPLYRATHKFKSGCGWPAYFDSLPGAVTRHTDSTFGMARTEITCSKCGGHLGHVFKGEGYPTPTDERHCVNSVSLKFSSKEGGT